MSVCVYPPSLASERSSRGGSPARRSTWSGRRETGPRTRHGIRTRAWAGETGPERDISSYSARFAPNSRKKGPIGISTFCASVKMCPKMFFLFSNSGTIEVNFDSGGLVLQEWEEGGHHHHHLVPGRDCSSGEQIAEGGRPPCLFPPLVIIFHLYFVCHYAECAHGGIPFHFVLAGRALEPCKREGAHQPKKSSAYRR